VVLKWVCFNVGRFKFKVQWKVYGLEVSRSDWKVYGLKVSSFAGFKIKI
jgi:hypothetical protein